MLRTQFEASRATLRKVWHVHMGSQNCVETNVASPVESRAIAWFYVGWDEPSTAHHFDLFLVGRRRFVPPDNQLNFKQALVLSGEWTHLMCQRDCHTQGGFTRACKMRGGRLSVMLLPL